MTRHLAIVGSGPAGYYTAARFKCAILNTDMFNRRAVFILQRKWALRAFQRNIVITNREIAVADSYVLIAVYIYTV